MAVAKVKIFTRNYTIIFKDGKKINIYQHGRDGNSVTVKCRYKNFQNICGRRLYLCIN
jgi:hypothetical protein